MKSIIYNLLFLCLISSSCSRQEELTLHLDAEGVVTSMPFQWRTSLSTKSNLIKGSLVRDVIYDVSHNGNVLFPLQNGEHSELAMLSSSNGEILWQWDNLYEKDKYMFFGAFYQYDNYLAFQQGERFYTIDLNNGATVQKALREHHVARITGFKDMYFSSGNTGLDVPKPYKGGIYTGVIGQLEEGLLFTPAYSYEYINGNGYTGTVSGISTSLDKNQDVLLVYGFADALPNWQNNIYFGLYNFTQKKHIYDKIALESSVTSSAISQPIVYNDKLYLSASKSIFCYELNSGNRIWKRDFPAGFTFSGYIIAGDKLLANSEDTYLYALDPATGQQLWKEKSSGTSSKMASLNGVVYFTGGGDGLLHAVDIATGKHLWRLRSPDLEVNRGAWFKREIMVIPPKRREKKAK
ncbi:MAG: PQQ-binding-like beta-propeller repeat protein [Cyclobacteriaceae bacterium]